MKFRLKRSKSRPVTPPSCLRHPSNETAEKNRFPKINFITFGGGQPKYRRAAIDLAHEAQGAGWFDEIRVNLDIPLNATDTGSNIRYMIPDWNKTDIDFIHKNRRGFGNWLWKPIIILTALRSMNDGEILVYADGGCEISPLGTQRFFDYVQLCLNYDAIFFETPYIESHYTKYEVFTELNTPERDKTSPQIQATTLMLKNCTTTRAWVERWLELCRRGSMRLISDERDMCRQLPEFRDHRHDQSILSLLVKQSDFMTIPAEDNFDKRLYLIVHSWVLLMPFHTRRTQAIRKTYRLAKLSNALSCRASVDASLLFQIQFALQTLLGLKFNFFGIKASRS